MRNVSRGAVVWVSFPAPHSPQRFKRRPGVLLTDPTVAEKHGSAAIVPLSSRIDLARSLTILVPRESPEGRAMGLLEDSRLFVDELTGVPWFAVAEPMGSCPLLGTVDRMLRELLGLR